ncbi:AAA family ATPase [Loigolactobacillus binensis]|uniref:Beta-carotene 15,15'-monooxygenase n=1 Tax=Loigolactobacillus binensis TaxID=2559922 RepID=A0ABW3EE34_9LACO|nr:hypothetical protein [Loigolactobacillus binensis]
MDTIKNYLTNKFATVPSTPTTEKAQAELLTKMTARYQELLAAGKNENEALGTVINEFDSLEELLGAATAPTAETKNALTLTETEIFWRSTRRLALAVAGGILGIALGVGAMIALIPTLFSWLGILLMLLGVIVGISLFITVGMAHERVKVPLDKRTIPAELQATARQRQQDYTSGFTIALVAGVALCIFALFPPILQAVWHAPGFGLLSGAAFIWILGSGLFAIIYGSIIYAGYTRIAQGTTFYAIADADERALSELKQRNPKMHLFLYQVYWPLITIAYLVISFGFGFWSLSWLLFPIAGILFGVIRNYALLAPKN